MIQLTKEETLLLTIILDREIAQASIDLGIDAPKTNDLRILREKIKDAV